MEGLLFILIPILLADIVNPVLFAGVVYTLGSRHPVVNTWGVILSFFASYFVAGLIIAVGLETFTDQFHIPHSFDYVLEFIVAMLLFYFSWKMYRAEDQYPEEQLKHGRKMSLWDSILMGFNINIIGLPFALPYLAGIDQILKADIGPITTLGVLFYYNVLYVLPFASMMGVRWYYQKESDAIFIKINQWVHRVSGKYLPFIFFLLGLLLIEDVVSYFIGYREYSFLSLAKGSSV